MKAKRNWVSMDTPFLPVIQKLKLDDQAHIEAHLLRLDMPDRRMRFGGTVGDHTIAAHSQQIDWSKTIVLGCFIDGELRGVAELIVSEKDPNAAAELAITVERIVQNKGIGTALIKRMLAIARNRFVRKIYMTCLLENHKMQHVAGKLDADLTFCEGEVEASIWPSVPTYLSLIEEASMDGQTLWRAMFDSSKTAEPRARRPNLDH